MRPLRPLAASLLLLLGPAPSWAAEPDIWDRAYDPVTGTRFIPLQLIIGGKWDGERTITYPSGTFAEFMSHGSVWSGPRSWQHPKTGETLIAYDRSRGGRSATDQVFAVRKDAVAIGRVADTRFGISACDQEAKYPLGLWTQGETREFESICWYGEEARPKVTTLTIRDIDFTYGGWEHCLKVEWVLRDKGETRSIDHRVYIFAPGKSVVRIE